MNVYSGVGGSLPSGYITPVLIPAHLSPSCPGLGPDSLLWGVKQAGEHLILMLMAFSQCPPWCLISPIHAYVVLEWSPGLCTH